MRRIVEAGGGSTGDIAKVVVYLKDRKDRDMVNVERVKMFPPARTIVPCATPSPVTCRAIA